MHIRQVIGGVHLHVRTCRCASFPYLGNGWSGYSEILCVVRDTLAGRFYKSLGWGTSARADEPSFPYLGNGLADCAEI